MPPVLHQPRQPLQLRRGHLTHAPRVNPRQLQQVRGHVLVEHAQQKRVRAAPAQRLRAPQHEFLRLRILHLRQQIQLDLIISPATRHFPRQLKHRDARQPEVLEQHLALLAPHGLSVPQQHRRAPAAHAVEPADARAVGLDGQQPRPQRRHRVPQRPGQVIPRELARRLPAAGQDHPIAPHAAPVLRPHGKPLLAVQHLLRAKSNDFCNAQMRRGQPQRVQHRGRRVRRRVHAPLALLAACQPHAFKPLHHAARRLLRKHPAHVRRRVILRPRMYVGQVAAPVARAQQLLAHALARLQHRHARRRVPLLRAHRRHQPRSAPADDEYLPHANALQNPVLSAAFSQAKHKRILTFPQRKTYPSHRPGKLVHPRRIAQALQEHAPSFRK